MAPHQSGTSPADSGRSAVPGGDHGSPPGADCHGGAGDGKGRNGRQGRCQDVGPETGGGAKTHHEEGIQMVDRYLPQFANPKVSAMAERIRAEHAAEIDELDKMMKM